MTDPSNPPDSWPALLPRLVRFLPPDQFERLRALPSDLTQVDQAAVMAELKVAGQMLEPLYRVLVNYAPRYLLELDPTPGQPHGELIEGSFIFADVTGFTALTELLCRQGTCQGYETMTQIINDLFARVLDPLIASGGDLLIFAGDAALAYFPRQVDGSDVLQAIRTALRIQRSIQPFASLETEAGPASLAMSIGVERGLAFAGLAGTARRMELLVSGPAIGAATRTEEQAAPGEVHLGPQARTIAGNRFRLAGARVVDDLGETLGDYEISLPRRKSGRPVYLGLDLTELLLALEASLQRIEQLAPFLPEDMLARLVNTDRQRRLQAEFRPVASQFVNIIGLETLALRQGPDLAARALQLYFVRSQEIVRRHQGIVNQIDAYGDSFILLNTFGIPTAHEGTRRSAVAASLELARALEQTNRDLGLDPPLRQRVGLTYDLTYNGEIGARYRREAVIAGPAVNRAARLMSRAEPGQIILDADIWARVRTAFVGEALPAVHLKGIDGPVTIVNVRRMRLGSRLQPPSRPPVGRGAEQSQLVRALDSLQDKNLGSAWLVLGQTGLGKTTLVSELARQARQRNLTVLVGSCQPHGRHIPLFPWIDLLTGWLEGDEHRSRPQQRDRLQKELASLNMSASEQALAHLLGLAADLAPGLPSAATGESGLLLDLDQKINRSVSPDINTRLSERLNRAASVKADEPSVWQHLSERVSGPGVIWRLLEKLAAREQLVIILEDLSWADADSLAVLDELLAGELPFLLVATAAEARPGQPAARLELNPLPDTTIVEIARQVLGATALDPALARWVCRQARGNPLYARELCQELLNSDAVHVNRASGAAHWTRLTPTLPLSLHQLLLARLDALSLIQQDVLRRAAVFGMTFALEGVAALSEGRLTACQIESAVEGAVQASLLTAPRGEVYCFDHPLIQETIYATLAFSQRQAWHTRIGDWLANQAGAEETPALELTAFHYLQGSDQAKAARFGRLAGDRAKASLTFEGATAYYQQVLALPDAPVAEKRRAAEGQADVLALQGNYAVAETAYSRAVELGNKTAGAKGE